MVLLAKCLLYKADDLSTPVATAGPWGRKLETGRAPELAGLTILTQLVSFKFNERFCLKKIEWRATEKDT